MALQEPVLNSEQLLQVKVYSPYAVFYDDKAKSVSAKNHTGLFDILPQHHNFISIIDPCEVIINKYNDEEVKIKINGGLMHVRSNNVTLFLDV